MTLNREQQFDGRSRERIRKPPPGSRIAYVHRVLTEALLSAIGKLELQTGQSVLDFGCADCPYASAVPEGVRYLPADLPGNENAVIAISTDGALQTTDASVDVVMSTQVLEHVVEPSVYLKEAFRVLKPGGQLLLSTHGIMLYHPDPVDYWRWTHAGLIRIIEASGFEVVEHSGVMGLGATGLQLIQDACWGSLPRWMRSPFAQVMQRLMSLADRLQTEKSRRLNALVFVVLARKPHL